MNTTEKIKFSHANIDLETATSEEIKAEIERLKGLANKFKNEEQAIKILLNSVYGGLANKWMVCFNLDTAEAVTHQGQAMIKYAEKIINHYFHDIWHKDVELHKKLGINTEEVKPVKGEMVIAGDTDSNYVCWDEVISSCNWKENPKDLILKVNEYRFAEFLNVAFNRYAERTGTKNYQDFELENISESGIWLAKKKYMLNNVWQDGIDINSLSQIKFSGIELVQSSTPPFAREKLKELIKFFFTKKKQFALKEVITMLKNYKEEFMISDPEKISMGRSVSDYNKYILNDSTGFEVASKCPIHVRAAGYYNYTLNQNPAFKNKYEMIRSGDKIKFYHVKSQLGNEVFGYLPGSFPIEFAPNINYDEQFLKTIIDPINRIVLAMGFPEIGKSLYTTNMLF